VARLRIPLLLVSLAFLFASLANLLWGNFLGHPLLPYLHERAARQAYAAQLRDDGLSRLRSYEYENARTRLDQAAQVDPGIDDDPSVIAARKAIASAPTLDDTVSR